MIVWLAAQNGRQAWAVYQDALGVEAFAASEQAAEAEALLDAYRSGDVAAVKSRAMGPVFLDLDTQVLYTPCYFTSSSTRLAVFLQAQN